MFGGDGDDAFSLSAVLTGSIAGQAGVDTLTNPAGTNSWTLTGLGSGTVTDLSNGFTSIENLTGGSGTDRFVFQTNGSVAGTITGAAGTDELDYLAIANPIDVNLANATASLTGGINGLETYRVNSGTFTGLNAASAWTTTATDTISYVSGTTSTLVGFTTLQGGSNADTFNLNHNSTYNIDGGSGSDTLSRAAIATLNQWSISGANSGSVTGLTGVFTNIENLTGGSGTDQFLIQNGGSLAGNILGGSGTDELNYTNVPADVDINLQNGTAAQIASFSSIESFVVNGGTFTGLNAASTWSLNGVTTNYVSGATNVSLTGFETLQGGNNVDTFNVLSASTYQLLGGAGNDVFDIDFALTGSINGEASTGNGDTLQGALVESVTLTTSANDGTATGALSGTFSGIETIIGNNATGSTLTGQNTNATWNLQSASTYVATGTLNFAGFQNLAGGSANDTYNLTATAPSFTSIDGNLGTDSVSRSSVATTNNWTISGTGNGQVNAQAFTNIEDLSGGTGIDNFAFTGGGSITGSLSANTGTDTLDVSASTVPTNVNLALGTASVIGGTFSSLEPFIGNGGSFTGLNAAGTWTLSGGTNATYLSGTSFNLSNFANLQGGTAIDTFNINTASTVNLFGGDGNDLFNLNATLTGSIDGQASTGTGDQLSGTQVDQVVLTTSAFTGTENSISGGFTSIETINAAATGGTLTGRDIASQWNVGATRTYVANSETLTFTNFTTLQGGSATDNFQVTANIATTLNLLGGAGNDHFQLTGTLTGAVDGQADNDTLSRSGVNAALAWTINALAGGTVTGLTGGFSNVENLTGGISTDTFSFLPGGSITGTVDAQAGTDTIDYSGISAAGVNVSLLAGTASLTGNILGFENITGSQAADTLVGDAGINVISGLDGNDTITGGGANDTLQGGNDTDTLLDTFAGTASLSNTQFIGNGTDTISGFEAANLTGSAGNDSLTLTFTGNVTTDGAGGSDTLTGPNVDANWNVTLGTLTTVSLNTNFQNFETLQGGSAIDTFQVDNAGATAILKGGAGNDQFILNGNLTGSIDGEASTLTGDRISGTAVAQVTLVGSTSAGTINSVTGGFTNIESISGNGQPNSTLTGLNLTGTWTLTAASTYVAGTTLNFDGFANLQGGTAIDTFNINTASTVNLFGGDGNDLFNLNATLTGSIDGQASTGTGDQLSGTQVDQVVLTTSAFTGTENSISGGFTSIETINAAATGGTLTGRDIASQWNLGATRTYVANSETLTFTNFTTLQGGSATDNFQVTANIATTLNLLGGAGNDHFQLTGTLTGAVDGQADNDTLSRSGVNAALAWTINALAGGTVTGLTGGFSNVENLTGGISTDSFSFLPGGSITGTVDAQAGTDTIDYSGISAAGVNVSLLAGTASFTGNILGFENITGSQAADTLVGDAGINVISGLDGNDTITGGGANDTLQGGNDTDTLLDTFAGTASLSNTQFIGNGTDTISGFEAANLTGSAGNDSLTLTFTGNVTTDGAGGSDTLTGPNVDANWNVTLGTLTTVSLNTNFQNFETLQGGSAIDTFQVDNAGATAILKGGAGNDQFILNGNLTGSIDGEASTLTGDRISGTAVAQVTLVGSTSAGTINSVTGGFTNIESISGNGQPNSTLTGLNVAGTWNLTATPTYVATTTLNFDGFANLQGGTAIDTFNINTASTVNLFGSDGNDLFNLNATLTGSIDGQASTGTGDQLSGTQVDQVVLTTSAFTGTENSISGGFTSIETINAAATGGTLTGRDIASQWNLGATRTYVANSETLTFTNFTTLQGGSATDNFQVTANIATTLNLLGGAGNDHFQLTGTLTGAVDGQADNDTLSRSGVNAALAWTINALGGGTVTGLTGGFSNVENLTGGISTDTFSFLPGGSITGTVDAQAGTDTIDYSGISAAGVNVSLLAGTASLTGNILGFENITGSQAADTLVGDAGINVISGLDGNDTITGGGANDTLQGGNDTDTLLDTFAGTASLSNTQFIGNGTDTISGLETANLTGSAGNDSLTLTFTGNVTTDGAGGSDTLTGPNVDANWNVTLGTLTTVSLNTNFQNFETLQGGSAIDTFQVDNAGATAILKGGAGNDQFILNGNLIGSIDGEASSLTGDRISGTAVAQVTLVGSTSAGTINSVTGGFTNIESVSGNGQPNSTLTGLNVAGTWNLTATPTYVATTTLNFDSFANLQGGTAIDTFNINTASTVNLFGGDGNDQFNITASLTGNVAGEAGTDTLSRSAVATDNTWTLDGVAQGSGNVTDFSGTFGFTGMENLVGGSGHDTFVFLFNLGTSQVGSVTGSINGGGGIDTLDYANINSPVTVSLLTNTATHVGSGISNFENITGGNGNDTLTGDANANTILGNGGNDTVTGGAGDDTLNGGGGDDLLLDIFAGVSSLTNTQFIGNGTDAISGFEQANLTGSNAADSLFIDFTGTITATGGGGADTLTGPNADAVWNVSTGLLVTTAMVATFSSFETLQGGNQKDRFNVTNAGASGTLRGGLGDDTFDLLGTLTGSINGQGDFDTLSGTVIDNVVLTAGTPTGFSGTETQITAGFSNIDQLVATNGSGSVTGLNANSDWLLGANSLYTSGGNALAFTGFTTILGGNQNDQMQLIGPLGTATHTIQGNLGTDSLTVNGATIALLGNNAFDFTAETIQIENSSLSTVDGNQSLSGAITFSGSTLATQGTGIIILGGNVTVSGTAATVLQGQVSLGTTATRTFTVNDVTGSSAADLQVDASIVATTGSVVKAGNGTLALNGLNQYTGTTSVNAGTLEVNGTLVNGTAATDVTIASGARLSGNGVIQGVVNVANGATLGPGTGTTAAGKLTTGNIVLSSGANFDVQVNQDTVSGTDYDQLNVVGTVNLNGAVLNTTGIIGAVSEREIVLINNDGTDVIVGTFAGRAEGSIVNISGVNFRLSYVGGTGNDVILSADTFVHLVGNQLTVTDIAVASNDTLVIESVVEVDRNLSRYIIRDTDPTRVLTTNIPGAMGNGTNTIVVPFNVGPTSLLVEGIGGNDSLSIDFTAGNFEIPVTFQRGTPGVSNNLLNLTGGATFNSVLHTAIDADSGNVNVTGNALITFNDVVAVQDELVAQNRSFLFSNQSDVITAGDAPAVNFNQIDSNFATQITFRNSTNTLAVNAAGGNDNVTINSFDTNLASTVAVNVSGGTGVNELTVATPDRATAAPQFAFAGFHFDQSKTPDVVTVIPPGLLNGGDGLVVNAFPDNPTGSFSFPAAPNAGFDSNLTIGNQLSGLGGARAINLPAGDNGVTNRTAIELSWSNAGQRLTNQAGNDFVVYESSSNPSGPDGYLVQVHTVGGTWSRWRFESADSRETYIGSANEGAFATAFDLSDFGVADGAQIDAIRITNLTAADRIEPKGNEPPTGTGTFRNQGYVLLNDAGKTSDTYPAPGPLASFDFFGASTFDPDPIYVAAIQGLNAQADRVDVAANTVAITTEGNTRPTITHDAFASLNVNTFGGNDQVIVRIGDNRLPTDIAIDGGSPTTSDEVRIVGSLTTVDQFRLSQNRVAESNSGTQIELSNNEKLIIDVQGDQLDDRVTVERDFVLSGVNPKLEVLGDHTTSGSAAVDQLIVNTDVPPPAPAVSLITAMGSAGVPAFDQASTPDQLVHLTGGSAPGAPIAVGGFDARVDNIAFSTGSAVSFPDNTSTFNGSLSLGRLAEGSTGASARFLNMPGGNNGQTTRSVIELTWSGGRQLQNDAGDDFIIFESGDAGVPEAFMVQVRQVGVTSNDGWTQWVYLPATVFQNSKFATFFNLTDFGVADGGTIDAIRIANMIDADRMVSDPIKVRFVKPEDNGATSALRPNPGPLASFAQYGASTLDPDPIYVGVLRSLVRPASAGTADHVTLTPDRVDVQGFIPIDYKGLERVTINTGGESDRIIAKTSDLTAYTINGGSPTLPTEPGDRLEWDLTGASNNRLTINDPGAGQLTSTNRRSVDVTGIETFGLPSKDITATYDLVISANSNQPNQSNDTSLDQFVLRRNDQTTEATVNGTLVFRGDRAGIHQITINGSDDPDTFIVDYRGGNPIASGILTLTGNGNTNQLILQNGSAESLTYNTASGTSGDIAITQTIASASGVSSNVTSAIHYTQLTAATQDNLTAKLRTFNLTAANDNVSIRDAGPDNDGRTGIYGTGTFVNVEFKNSTVQNIVHAAGGNDVLSLETVDLGYRAITTLFGEAGNDLFLVDSNGTTAGGTVDFVKFPVQIRGGGDTNDRLIVNDTSDSTGDRFSITESTIGGEENASGSSMNNSLAGNASPTIDGTISPNEWSDIPLVFDTGLAFGQTETALLHWTFADGPGRVTQDQTQNNNDGTLFVPSGPQFVTSGGQFNGYLNFDGVDDHASFRVPNNPGYDFGPKGTFSFWVLMDNQTRRNAFMQSADSFPGNGMEFEYRPNNGGELFAYLDKTVPDGSAFADSSLILQQGNQGVQVPGQAQWFNIQYSWDHNAVGGPEAHIYIDGAEVTYNGNFDSSMSNWTQTLNTVNTLFELGRHRTDATRYFDGGMDDVAIFNTVLSQAERNQIVTSNLGVITSSQTVQAIQNANFSNSFRSVAAGGNLVAYWSFDNPAGTVQAVGEAGTSIVTLNLGTTVEGVELITGGGPTLPGRTDTLSAAEFDGDRDAIQLSNNNLNFNSSQGSIAFWVRPTTEQVRNTVNAGSSTLFEDTTQQFEVGISWRDDAGAALSHADMYGRIFFSPQQNFPNDSTNIIVSNSRLNLDAWNHVVITWDYNAPGGPNATIYINGKNDGYLLNNLPTQWTAPALNTGNWVVGGDAAAQPLDRWFDGRMADVAFFDSAMNAAQAQNLFQNSFSGARGQFAWDANNLYGLVLAYPGAGGTAQPSDLLKLELFDDQGTLLAALDTSLPLPPGADVRAVTGATGGYEFSLPLNLLSGFDPNTDFLQYRLTIADAGQPGASFVTSTSTLGYALPPKSGPTATLKQLDFTQQETLFGLGGRLEYSGLADLEVTTGSGSDSVRIYDEPTVNNDPLSSPNRSFKLLTGGGDDQVVIESIDAGYHAETNIRGESGNDVILQSVDLRLGLDGITTGSLYFEAEAIRLDASLNTRGGTATYDGHVELMRDLHIDTDSTDVPAINVNAQGGLILFTINSPIDSQVGEFNDLTLDAGIASITFLNTVGLTQALDAITIEQAHNVLFDQTVDTTGNVRQSTGTGATTFSGTSGNGIGGALFISTNQLFFKASDVVTVGDVDLIAQNDVQFGAAAGLDAGASTIEVLVNQDGIGSQGLTQNSSAVIQTTNVTASAIAVVVGGNGNALISVLQTGTTSDSAKISLLVGGFIQDNRNDESANLVTSRAVLNAGTGIGTPTNDIDTAIKFLEAITQSNYIRIDEFNDIRLDGVRAAGPFFGVPVLEGGPPQIAINSQTGNITILDSKKVTSSTGQVSNAPPRLRLDEVNPNDVIIPGDPTQEVTGTLGGIGAPGENLELGVNFKLTVRWDDGVVSVLDFPTDANVSPTVTNSPSVPILQAGDEIVWNIDENNVSTASIKHSANVEGPITITIQRTFSLFYLQTVQVPEVAASFVLANDPNIVLTDSSGTDLNQTTPLIVKTALAEDQFRQNFVLAINDDVVRVEEVSQNIFVEVTSSVARQTQTYIDTELVEDDKEQEVPTLFLVRVGADGNEGPRVTLPLSELQNISALLERLKNSRIPNGLYRIYYAEPGLPPQKLLEFRKTGNSIGDPVREPGRGSNPTEDATPATGTQNNIEAIKNDADGNAAIQPAGPAQEQVSYRRVARQVRMWQQ